MTNTAFEIISEAHDRGSCPMALTLRSWLRLQRHNVPRPKLLDSHITRTPLRAQCVAGSMRFVSLVESLEVIDEHTTRHLQFAQEHERWTDGQWVRILDSDETHTCLDTPGQVWTQRSKEAAYQSP